MAYRTTDHLPLFHRAAPVKEPVRVATTANVTISTALNNGDTIDGVTLATNDRVLVWQQSTASQNGIYRVAATPARAYDMDTADEVPGCLVAVLAGTTYSGSIFHNTNTDTLTLDTTSITFEQVGAPEGTFVLTTDGGEETVQDHGNVGSTETITPANGNIHVLTLDANCTLTLGAPESGKGCSFTLEIHQDSTGGRSITWPSINWSGGSEPTIDAGPNAVTFVVLYTRDGGTTWYGFPVGGGTTTTTTSGQHDHVHVVGEPLVADGISSTFYLANYPEDHTVAAYINGIRTDVTQVLDAVTFSGVPPYGAAIRFDYQPEMV